MKWNKGVLLGCTPTLPEATALAHGKDDSEIRTKHLHLFKKKKKAHPCVIPMCCQSCKQVGKTMLAHKDEGTGMEILCNEDSEPVGLQHQDANL